MKHENIAKNIAKWGLGWSWSTGFGVNLTQEKQYLVI